MTRSPLTATSRTLSQSCDPIARPSQIVVHGRARFTVLTDRCLRCEWHENRRFEDRATLTVVNRRLETTPFTCEKSTAGVVIRTGALELVCTDTEVPFTATTLRARFLLDGKPVTWRHGQEDRRNLGGTLRTLDGVDGDQHTVWKTDAHGKRVGERRTVDLGPGLLSRSGWAIHDDADTIALGVHPQAGRSWVAPRHEGTRQDGYLFAYGHDYTGCLRDAAAIFGRQPPPPRYALGYWYSKFWAYTDTEIEDLVTQHDRMGVPIDVMVIDMDWHEPGWTGYTWSKDYFPDHAETLAHLHARDLKVTLNLHPADGVKAHESAFPAMRQRLGLGKQVGHIPFDITCPRYMQAYFELLHHPLEDEGVDFWWMDWQQGRGSTLPGLDPLPWLNQLHWEDQLARRPQRRALNFSRYGGLGSGRYPVGFSGDTISNWASLAFQPRLTAQAANVIYGTWSHDLGGHVPGPIAPELYLRWLQFGIFSPIVRTHASKNPEAERRVWQYPAPFDGHMITTLRRRYELVPYIYGELRTTWESGVSLLRPMYYHDPGRDEAYRARDQYWFGSQMIVAPVITPCDAKSKQATVRLWLPDGDWIDTAHGQRLSGGWHTRRYLIDEVPVFVRPGTIIPGQCEATRLKPGGYRHLLLEAWAGADGETTCYEDDGVSAGWQRGASARIPIQHRERRGNRSLRLGPIAGRYASLTTRRRLRVRVHLAAPAKRVCINGRDLAWSYRGGPDTWRYDGDSVTLLIEISTIDLRQETVITIDHLPLAAPLDQGLCGRLRRLRQVMELSNLASLPWSLHPEERLFTRIAQCGNRIGRRPDSIADELATFARDLNRLPKIITAWIAGMKHAIAYMKRKRPDMNTQLNTQLNFLLAARSLITSIGLERPVERPARVPPRAGGARGGRAGNRSRRPEEPPRAAGKSPRSRPCRKPSSKTKEKRPCPQTRKTS